MIEAICNPTAGNGRGEKIGRQVEAALRQRGVPCRLTMTKGPGDATTLARGFAAEGAETALATGGKTLVPFDEVIEAMKNVGKSIPYQLRETALGGMAAAKSVRDRKPACAMCGGCK